jgi:ATP-binding cassette subfamily B protein
MSIYRRVIHYYVPHSWRIAFATFLLLITIALNLLKPWPLKWIVDEILSSPKASYHLPWFQGTFIFSEAVLWVVGIFLGINLLWGIFNVWNNFWLIRIGLDVLLRLRTELYAHLQGLPLKFHENHKSGDSIFRVAYDTQAIQTFFNRGFTTILGSVITLISSFIIMWNINSKLSLLSLLIIPFLFVAIKFYAVRIRTQTASLQQKESDVLSRASEGLTSVRVVHAFGREEHEVRSFIHEAKESLSANLQLNLTSIFSTLIVSMIVAFGTGCLIYFGCHEVHSTRMSMGDLLVFMTYVGMLYQPLEQLSYTAWSLEGAAAGMQRVFEILDTQNGVPDSLNARKIGHVKGDIAFEHVDFEYEKGHPVLKNLSFKIQSGKSVAFVGATGTGKTTILSLIPRFYDPVSGYIKIDGEDLKNFTKKSVRENISMVLQDTVLFNTTIEENISYGKFGATKKEIESAAIAAQAHNFILSLPKGYQTIVGERGVKLSGGQRQRIGMARAFLKGSPVLLLDEPTSALDPQTESEILDALKNLMKQQTTIMVTHRLTTIHHVDEIFVLEAGKIVEQGSGADLLERKGVYYKLWHSMTRKEQV